MSFRVYGQGRGCLYGVVFVYDCVLQKGSERLEWSLRERRGRRGEGRGEGEV